MNTQNTIRPHRLCEAAWPRMRLATLASLLILLFVAGCTQQESTPLRVGTIVWPGYEPLYVARHLGYLDTSQVRMVESTSTSEILRDIRNGSVEAGCMTLDEALLLAQDAPDIRIVLVMDISNGADVIMAKPEIASLKELKGRRIGAETTALGAYVLTRALQLAGLTPHDVEIVPMEASEHETGFKKGSVDAVVTFDPTRTKLLKFGARQIFDSSKIPGELVDVLVVRDKFLQEHPEKVKHLIQAWYRALAYFQEKPQDASQIAATRTGTTPQEFLSSLDGLYLPDAKEVRHMLIGQPPEMLKTTQKLAAVMREQGLLQKDVDIQSLFDESMLNRVFP